MVPPSRSSYTIWKELQQSRSAFSFIEVDKFVHVIYSTLVSPKRKDIPTTWYYLLLYSRILRSIPGRYAAVYAFLWNIPCFPYLTKFIIVLQYYDNTRSWRGRAESQCVVFLSEARLAEWSCQCCRFPCDEEVLETGIGEGFDPLFDLLRYLSVSVRDCVGFLVFVAFFCSFP